MFLAVTMARYSHLPKQEHLKTMFRIFGYLKNHLKGAIKFDLSIPEIKSSSINKWKELYPDALEKMPDRYPVPKGKDLALTAGVDADHAHDLETRWSATGVILFLNKTPIKWYSKER